ncbi:50S ribosomal protein L5 [Candidatus Dojkabacteria bacterium]|nr:50S ribosomal protein L5 [Candidatus Dojkabacteria bacterium]
MSDLKEKYKKEILPELKKELKVKNDFEVPTLKQIVVNIGLGEVVNNKQVLEKVSEDLAVITGQKPLVTRAKKAISNFKIRKGLEIGLKIDLRSDRMWDFFEKVVSIVLPRIKDFRGVSRKAFDGFGNYSLGIRDHTVFPEIDPNKVDKIRSFQINIITTARNDKQGFRLLELLGMPFAKVEDMRMMEKMQEAIRKERKEQEKMKAQRQSEGKDIEERRVEE